jgi:hypothetical protein
MLLEPVVAHALHVLLGHHPARPRHERAVEVHEVEPGVVQVESDPVRIHDDDLADLVVEDLRSLGAVEAELHVLGGERIAVVETQSLPQLELVDAPVGAHGPGLGQTG